MIQSFIRAVALVAFVVLPMVQAIAVEPYPFKTKPREIKTDVWLKIDFEGSLPEAATLGTGTIEPEIGAKKSKGLVSKKKGTIAKFPIVKFNVGISRFDLALEHGGEGFSYFVAKLNAYDKKGKVFKTVSLGGGWGITPGVRAWQLRTANIEAEGIYAVELELEQTSDSGTVQIDNIVLRKHEEIPVFGRAARRQLTSALKKESAEVGEVGDLFVATYPERVSYFDFSSIDEQKRYVRSQWQQRLHVGTTYKKFLGKLPTFVLGVSARQSGLELAAKQQKKTLLQMYEFFLNDVAEHGFNTVWVDVTKDLEKFDTIAESKGISVILRDPNWSDLEKWVAQPTGPMPAEFKKTAAANFARYGKLKSLVGYHMHRPLSSTYQPMLAKAREYLNSLNPEIQLVSEESSVYTNKTYENPMPNLGIQTAGHYHYAGRPWIKPSNIYHPNFWPEAIGEGYFRMIHDGYRVNHVPCLLSIPCSRQYGKKSINMQQDRVITDKAGWVYDTDTKRWSGWYRYKYPQNLLKSMVWKAVQSGSGGILINEWGPATVADNITGTAILADSKLSNTSYQPDLLRKSDMSESDGWKELGEVGRKLANYRELLAITTLHGNNDVKTNNSNVKVRTLTGKEKPFKVLAIVNMNVGEYDQEALQIDPSTGELKNYISCGPTTFSLTIPKDYGLIDLVTGKSLEPSSEKVKGRVGVYSISLDPGEGRLYYRGKQTGFLRFIDDYKIVVKR